MSFPRSETQAISNHFAGYSGESESKTKAKAKAAANSVPVDDDPSEDLLEGGGIGSLSLAEQTRRKSHKSERQDAYTIFADVPYGPPPPFDAGPGPCHICDGPHLVSVCACQFRCPLNAKVGKYYKVVCGCGLDLINGKCGRKGCDSTFGCAMYKDFEF